MAGIDPRILQVGLAVGPEIIDFFKTLWKQHHPDAAVLTDDEAKAGLAIALTTSLAGDAGYYAKHPTDQREGAQKPVTGSS